jgi:hypothetical protein
MKKLKKCFYIKFGLKIFFSVKFRSKNSCCPFTNLAAQIIKHAAQKIIWLSIVNDFCSPKKTQLLPQTMNLMHEFEATFF